MQKTLTTEQKVTKTSKNKSFMEKRSKKEANARREIAERWDHLSQGGKYKRAAAKESSIRSLQQVKDEFFDGILLSLHKYSDKSGSVQKRILRRIVEKRQAQSVCKRVGRTNDRFASYLLKHCTSISMNEIKRYRFAM